MKWGIEKALAAAFGLGLAVLVVSIVVSFGSADAMARSAEWQAHTLRVLHQLETVSATLNDAEAGQRGYLLTGRPSYLDPYRSALEAITSELQELETLVHDDPSQRERFDRLMALVSDRLTELQRTMALRDTAGLDAALRLVGTDRGKASMDEIRVLVREMESEENAALVQRSQAVRAQTRSTLQAISLGSLLTMAIAALASVFIRRDLEGRRKAHRELQESETRFRQLAENTDQLFWMADPTKPEMIYVSPAYESIWGRSCESLYEAPASFLDPVLPEDRERAASTPERQLRGERTQAEYRIARPDGSIRWIRDRGFPIRDERGRVFRVAGIAEDVTARKQTEAALHHRVDMERLVASISTRVLTAGTGELDRAIDECLRALGEFARVDRSYVFLFSDDGTTMDNTHEWCAEGIEPQKQNLVGLASADFPWLVGQLRRLESAHIPRVADLPEAARPEKAILEAQDIRSLVIAPLACGPAPMGFLGLDAVRSEETWSDEDLALLQVIAGIFANGLLRERDRAALAESEARYRRIVETSAEGIWMVDEHDRTTFANGRMAEMLGVMAGDLAGRSLFDFTDESGREAAEAKMRLRRDGVSSQHDFKYVRADGGELWGLVSATPIPDAAGRYAGALAMVTDITERKRAEEALHRREQEFRALAENSPDIIARFDRDLRCVYLNPAIERASGQPPGALIGKTHAELGLPAHLVAGLTERLSQVLRTGREAAIEIEYPMRDGPRHYHTRIVPEFAIDGSVESVLAIARDLTEQKRAHDAMLESRERSRALAEATFEGIAIHEDGKLLEVNESLAAMFGYERHELIGRSVLELAAPECRDLVTRSVRDRVETPYEAVGLKKDGTRFVGELRGRPMQYKGRTVRVVAARDVTERKRAENELRNRERQLAEAQQRARLGSWEWDLGTNAETWSDELYRIYGLDPTQVRPTYDTFLSRVHPDDRGLVERANRHALRTGIGPHVDFRIRCPDGTVRTVHAQGEVVADPAGKPVRLVGTTQDITERKQVELALAAEKERLAVTLRSIADGVIATDTLGRIVLVNPVAETLTGWTQDTAAGRPVAEVFRLLDEATRRPQDDFIQEMQATGEGARGPFQGLLVAADGTERIVSCSGAPIRAQGGDVLGVVFAFQDITRHRRIDEELQRASRLDSVGVLAGGIAHDFNNILTGILANISLARLVSGSPGRLVQRLAEAEKAAQRASQLTHQLLTFAKGGAPIRKTAPIAELVRDCALFALRGTNVRPEFDIPDDLWPAEVDEGQISQVIQNLVINAQQAMPQGGVVDVRARNLEVRDARDLPLRNGRYIRLSIEDHGVGIPPELLARIFDPFFTTKKKGSGLGLATSYSIVQKHDGTIDVDSETGAGSRFDIYLPASDRQAPERDGARPVALQGQGRVLAMDDDESMRETLRDVLSELGYEPTVCADGNETLDLYRQALAGGKPFDAVILDLTVPGGMGGRQAIAHLLEIDPRVKAIVSSGYANDSLVSSYAAHGFRGVVTKPYTAEELAGVLSRVIGRMKAEG